MFRVVRLDLVDQIRHPLTEVGTVKAAAHEVRHDLGDLLECLVQHFGVKRFLRTEVVEDSGLVCPGYAGDLLDGDPREPSFREEFCGSIKDGPSSRLAPVSSCSRRLRRPTAR